MWNGQMILLVILNWDEQDSTNMLEKWKDSADNNKTYELDYWLVTTVTKLGY